jgi:hypothetical protein
LVVLLFSGIFTAAAGADTIVVSNTGFGGAVEDSPGEVLYTSWTQTGAFTDVSVSADLDGNFPYDQAFSGEAYLTTMIGAGTTVADQIAAAPFSVAAGASGPVLLFSGLNLGPDTYYLVVEDTSGDGGWDIVPGPSVTAPGVTTISNHCQLYGTGYPPSYSSDNICGGNLIGFQVVSVSETSAVPEPATPGVVLIGSLGLLLLRRRCLP